MLVHILDRNVFVGTGKQLKEDIPKDILEMKESLDYSGIFALRVIPEGVKFGPFRGSNKRSWKVEEGSLTVRDDLSEFPHWMQYINATRNVSEQNLLPIEYKNNLYYRSVRKILQGEELLVYFSEKCEDSLNEDVKMEFFPAVESDIGEVFACTFCCMGFSSKVYLTKHNGVCPNKINGGKFFTSGKYGKWRVF